MNRIDYATARLNVEEGRRRYCYDDATSKTFTLKPHGNLSVGIGIDLEVGLDDDEINWLFSHRLNKTNTALMAFDWYVKLDEPRASVYLDVAFNSGVTGMLHFHKSITAASIGDWGVAHIELLDSDAARADPNRYNPLAEILLTGNP